MSGDCLATRTRGQEHLVLVGDAHRTEQDRPDLRLPVAGVVVHPCRFDDPLSIDSFQFERHRRIGRFFTYTNLADRPGPGAELLSDDLMFTARNPGTDRPWLSAASRVQVMFLSASTPCTSAAKSKLLINRSSFSNRRIFCSKDEG